MSKIIACDTRSHENDNLCQIGNPSRTIHAVELIWQDMPYFSSFTAKWWPNDPEDIAQGQRSLFVTHPLMVVINCAKYGKNPSRTVDVTERTRHAERTDRKRKNRWSETNIHTPPLPSHHKAWGYWHFFLGHFCHIVIIDLKFVATWAPITKLIGAIPGFIFQSLHNTLRDICQ